MPEIKINPILNVHENYNNVMLVNPYRFSTGASYEPETVNYLAAVGIADDATVYYSGTPQEKTGNGFYVAVDTYVKSLKTAGVFSKLKAVYPMIGGNASTHKWNLINPQDTDAAFRMLWFGGGVHSKTGWKGNGVDAYGDTRFFQDQFSVLNNESFGVYSMTENTSNTCEIGTGNSRLFISEGSGTAYYTSQNTSTKSLSVTSSLGFMAANRITNNEFSTYRGLTKNIFNNNFSSVLDNDSFLLSAWNNNGVASGLSSRELPYAFIGEGLTETQMTAHYNAVQQLQTDLGRQV